MLTALTTNVTNRLTYFFGGLATQVLAYLNEIDKCIRIPFANTTTRKAADYSVLAGDNGKSFLATAAVAFSLPAAAAGLHFWFAQSADANMSIVGAATSIISNGNAGVTTVAYSTANNKIGAAALFVAVEVSTDTYKWFHFKLSASTATLT